MAWISVKDRLPEHGQVIDVWVLHNNDSGERFTDAEYDKENGIIDCESFWFGNDIDLYDDESEYKVTHWMPLPEPPQEGGGE